MVTKKKAKPEKVQAGKKPAADRKKKLQRITGKVDSFAKHSDMVACFNNWPEGSKRPDGTEK